jgi:hypothetical protein
MTDPVNEQISRVPYLRAALKDPIVIFALGTAVIVSLLFLCGLVNPKTWNG